MRRTRINRLTLFVSIEERNGERVVVYPNGFSRAILSLNRDRVKVVVTPDARPKSQKQLGYYRAVVLPHFLYALKDAGNDFLDINNPSDLEYCHQLLLDRFAPKEPVILPDGSEMVGKGSTSTMTVIEMTDYIEAVRKWLIEIFNLYVPDPDVNWRQ